MAAGEILYTSIFRSPNRVLRVHPSHVSRFDESGVAHARCVRGKLDIAAIVVVDETLPRDTVALSQGVLSELQAGWMQSGHPVHYQDGRLMVVPVIGVLCNPKWDAKRAALVRHPQLPSMTKLAQAAEHHGALIYLLRSQDVDMNAGMTTGYIFQRGEFVRRRLPLPDVIYDQLVSRKIERDKSVDKTRSSLVDKYHSRMFNDGFFDKWQVHEWLSADSRVRPFVPMTIRHTTERRATAFLQNHAVTFLKPLHGSLGIGIVRVQRKSDGTYEFAVKHQSTTTHHKVNSAKDVMVQFKRRLKARSYIWQQGIDLLTIDGRPMDIRILMQKDGEGVWQRTKLFARVAGAGDFTSNLSSGGEAMSVTKMLELLHAKPQFARKCRRLIRQVSSHAAEAIERGAHRQFGELGIDLGIDETGHVWIIEVNSKPHKSPTTEQGNQALVDLSFMRPIEYAIHLAKSR